MKSIAVITRLTVGLALAAALAGSPNLSALEVHKWIDERGVAHYSGSPPESADMAAIETFEYNDSYRTSEPDYKSILELAKELEQSRLARERLRAREAAQASALTPAPIVGIPPYNGGVAYPITSPYYPSGFYDHHFGDADFPYDDDFPYNDSFPYGNSSGLQRGSFVPGVKQSSFFHNPAARANAMGGVAIDPQ